jgi:hypothetical protein
VAVEVEHMLMEDLEVLVVVQVALILQDQEEQETHLLSLQLKEKMEALQEEIHQTTQTLEAVAELLQMENLLLEIFQVEDLVEMVVLEQHQV